MMIYLISFIFIQLISVHDIPVNLSPQFNPINIGIEVELSFY